MLGAQVVSGATLVAPSTAPTAAAMMTATPSPPAAMTVSLAAEQAERSVLLILTITLI